MGAALDTVEATVVAAIPQVLSAFVSFSPDRPVSAPTARTAEKAAASTERSNVLRIIGFVLT
ncbi:hypothetical protein [Streptomyces sp. NPDC044948]|uniref:hypothetical protein n=1 Tax=Streptomyces sp. NPDC044948 TaxID=3157092 RepID=UPI0033EA48A0